MRSTRKKWTALMTGLTLSLAFVAFPATSRADTVALGPYGSASWTLNGAGNVASFVFSANYDAVANTGYLLIDGNVADVNVNATGAGTVTMNGFAWTQPATGFNTQQGITAGGAGNIGGVGDMNQTSTATDGFGQAMITVSFDITRSIGTWANAAAVLTANALGNFVAAHFALCNGTCSNTNTASSTFFAGNVPLPPAVLLFGTALVGMGILGRRRKKELTAA